AQAVDSTVLGSNAWVTKDAENSVSLGTESLADRANTVSVGASHDWTDAAGVVHKANTRQITNVAAGTEATDAVNVAQLQEATGTANHYFAANGNGDGSDDAQALGDNGTAVGSASLAMGNGSSALGSGTTALGDYSTAIGYGSVALDTDAVAIGNTAQANAAS